MGLLDIGEGRRETLWIARGVVCPLPEYLPVAMQLVVIAGLDKGAVFPLTVGGKVQIGRSPTTTTRFKDTTVSRVHCEVRAEADRVVVVDLNSSGGTFVNNERISQ